MGWILFFRLNSLLWIEFYSLGWISFFGLNSLLWAEFFSLSWILFSELNSSLWVEFSSLVWVLFFRLNSPLWVEFSYLSWILFFGLNYFLWAEFSSLFCSMVCFSFTNCPSEFQTSVETFVSNFIKNVNINATNQQQWSFFSSLPWSTVCVLSSQNLFSMRNNLLALAIVQISSRRFPILHYGNRNLAMFNTVLFFIT